MPIVSVTIGGARRNKEHTQENSTFMFRRGISPSKYMFQIQGTWAQHIHFWAYLDQRKTAERRKYSPLLWSRFRSVAREDTNSPEEVCTVAKIAVGKRKAELPSSPCLIFLFWSWWWAEAAMMAVEKLERGVRRSGWNHQVSVAIRCSLSCNCIGVSRELFWSFAQR